MKPTHSPYPRRRQIIRRPPVPVRSLTARAFNALGWSYGTGLVYVIAQVGYTALTARLVAPAAFGGYALALTAVQLAGLFGAGSLGNAVMRVPELTDRSARTALTLAIGYGALLSAALLALAGPLARWLHMPSLAQALQIMAVQPPMLAASGVATGLLRRGQRYQAASLIDLASTLSGFVIGAATTALGMGVAGLSLGQVTNGAVGMVVGLAWAQAPVRPALDRACAREFMNFSAQVAGQNMGHYMIGNMPLWSVARLAGGTAAGLFSRAYQVVALPTAQFTVGLMRALYPLYREVGPSKLRTQRALTEALVITSGACAVIFGTFAAFAEPATLILLGARWHAAAAITPLLCAFAAVNTLYSVLASAAEAMRWMRMIWITQLVFLAVMIASLLAAHGRLVPTALAMVAATTLTHFFMLSLVSRAGFLHVAQLLGAYLAHGAIGLALAIIPPLISGVTVGRSIILDIIVRAGVTAVLWLGLWLLRGQVPGLRLGLSRMRAIHLLHRA